MNLLIFQEDFFSVLDRRARVIKYYSISVGISSISSFTVCLSDRNAFHEAEK